MTLDNSDYMFASVYRDALERKDLELAGRIERDHVDHLMRVFDFFQQRAVEVTGREIAQVLLLHVNALNAKAMPELLKGIRGKGYRIVPLEEALRDEAYQMEDGYVGAQGWSWIHRWSRTKGMPNKGEPDEPAYILEAYRRIVDARR